MTEKVVFVLGSCRLQTGESKIFGPAARASPPTEETWFCIFIHLKLDACMLFRNPKLNFCKRWRGVAIWGGRGQVGKGVARARWLSECLWSCRSGWNSLGSMLLSRTRVIWKSEYGANMTRFQLIVSFVAQIFLKWSNSGKKGAPHLTFRITMAYNMMI